eukprot:TRINITY_DN15674_c0_g1_i1.p1 TRINITY_DN15674_c0_g1~~TRINITY_DN15674_c0_g1_i1.p1  ORF type:complete len:271 (-),score=46.21 TRINITY_DN15674_c0_g1_i1:71-799(-)
MNDKFFKEIGSIFEQIDLDKQVVCAILWSEGKNFTAGLDLKEASSNFNGEGDEIKQKWELFQKIDGWQKNFESIRKCKKPVIAAIHGMCLGGGIDLVTACDIRISTSDAIFSVRETRVAIVADLGTLQRIEKISPSLARLMCFTGNDFTGAQCEKGGLVTETFSNKEDLITGARKIAKDIASNSPLTVFGTKISLNYAQNHNLQDSLNQVAFWNLSFLKSDDLVEAFTSFMQKTPPKFKSSL